MAYDRHLAVGSVEWSTADELYFLHKLGKWSDSVRCRLAGRCGLLRGYKASCLTRADWGRVDRGAIMAALDKHLVEFGG